MSGLTVSVLLQDIKKLDVDALIVGFHENVRPLKNLAGELDWLLCGSLSNLIIRNKMRGALADMALLTSRGKIPARKIFVVGLGPKESVSPDSLTVVTRTATASAVNAGAKTVAIECRPPEGMAYETVVPALVTGILQGSQESSIDITLLAPDAAGYEQIARLLNEHDGHAASRARKAP